MKSFSFPYSISYGVRDNEGGSITVALSDVNAKRLIRSAEEGNRSMLSEDQFISDIDKKVYQAVCKELTNQLLKDPSPVWDALGRSNSKGSKDSLMREIEDYLDRYIITVYYPEDLQLLQPKESKKKSKAVYLIMDEADAEELDKKDHYENHTIVLTDNGKTLFHVPRKFSGTVVIPASVRKIRSGFLKGAFNKREKISEIIIEKGLTEIDERTFTDCSSLKKITIPSSVKKIGSFAFTGCSSLEEVCLSEGLEELENTAFNFCIKLKELRLPSTLKEISKHINSYSDPISDLYFLGMNTKILDRGGTWDRLTMHVLPGSEAEKFAIEQKIQYEIIN